jgi:hypothetical protein
MLIFLGGERMPFGELLSVWHRKYPKRPYKAQKGGFYKAAPSYESLPLALKSLLLHGVPCYEGENTDLKIALFYIRCDAAAVGYKVSPFCLKILLVYSGIGVPPAFSVSRFFM